jgi:hypothetical protein
LPQQQNQGLQSYPTSEGRMAQQNTCASQKSWFSFDNQIEHYKQQIGQELYAIGGIVFSYY